jgi:hypothetical protein
VAGPPAEGIGRIASLHELVGQHAADNEYADDPTHVVIGFDTDSGPMMQTLLAAALEYTTINLDLQGIVEPSRGRTGQ